MYVYRLNLRLQRRDPFETYWRLIPPFVRRIFSLILREKSAKSLKFTRKTQKMAATVINYVFTNGPRNDGRSDPRKNWVRRSDPLQRISKQTVIPAERWRLISGDFFIPRIEGVGSERPALSCPLNEGSGDAPRVSIWLKNYVARAGAIRSC